MQEINANIHIKKYLRGNNIHIYTQAGRRAQEMTAQNIIDLQPTGINLIYGNITKLTISGRKFFGNKGTALEGIVNIPCQNREVSFKIAPIPTTDAPKHYEAFLKEMNCPELLGFAPEFLAGRKAEVGVLLNSSNVVMGYI